MIVRYVRLLTESQRHTLAEIMKHDVTPRARVRAHGILLSSQGMKIKEIAKIYQVDRDTVTASSRNGNIMVWRVSMISPGVADHPSSRWKKKTLHSNISKKIHVV